MLPTAPPTRPTPRVLFPALLVVAALIALFALTARSEASLPGAGGFGIATGGAIQERGPATLGRDLDVIRDAGAKWVRIDINWAQIQSRGPSSYDWDAIDRVVEGATSRGMSVLGGILYTPGWARPAGTESTYGPDPDQYAAFAERAVAHYSALGVHAYEVWNEPNAKAFWTPAPECRRLHGAAEGRLSGDQGGRSAGHRRQRQHRPGAGRRRGHRSRSGSYAASTRQAAATHSTPSATTPTAGRPIPVTRRTGAPGIRCTEPTRAYAR